MSHIDYALYESPVGYALFKVVHQADAVGLKLKETQAAANDLAKFGKMVKLANFSPFRYDEPWSSSCFEEGVDANTTKGSR